MTPNLGIGQAESSWVLCRSYFERMKRMPKKYTPGVKARAVTYVLDLLDHYKSVHDACWDLAP